MKSSDRLIQIFFGLWLLCFALSLSLPFLMEAKGDGFTRGLNRLGTLIGWQFGATVFALLGFFAGIGQVSGRRAFAWLSRGPVILQAVLIAAVISMIVYINVVSKPLAEPAYTPPPTTSAPALSLPAEETQPVAKGPQTQSYSGIYHRGFEASHFYSSDGQGPWWVESSSEADEKLAPFFTDGPGRSGGTRVALMITGWLSNEVADLAHLGSFQKRLHIVSIESVRALSPEEFEQVRTAFLSQ